MASFLDSLTDLNLNFTSSHELTPISRAESISTTTGAFVVGRGAKVGDIPGPEAVNSAGLEIGDDNGLLMIAAGVLAVAIVFSLVKGRAK